MIGRRVYFRRYCLTGYGYCTLMLHEFADANVWQALSGDIQRVTKSAKLWIISAAKRDTLGMKHFTGQQ